MDSSTKSVLFTATTEKTFTKRFIAAFLPIFLIGGFIVLFAGLTGSTKHFIIILGIYLFIIGTWTVRLVKWNRFFPAVISIDDKGLGYRLTDYDKPVGAKISFDNLIVKVEGVLRSPMLKIIFTEKNSGQLLFELYETNDWKRKHTMELVTEVKRRSPKCISNNSITVPA